MAHADPHELTPYASPLAEDPPETPPSTADLAWRHGKWLVAPPQADLPPRCVQCNGQATRRYQLKRIHFRLFQPPTRVDVRVYFCPQHYRSQRRRRWLEFATLASAASFFLSAALSVLFGAAAFAMIPVVITAILFLQHHRKPPLYFRTVETNRVWIWGAGEAFLASLPEFSESHLHGGEA